MKKPFLWMIACASLVLTAGCALRQDPLGSIYADDPVLEWKFDGTTENFKGEMYALNVNRSGDGNVLSTNGALVLYVTNADNSGGGGWFWDFWRRNFPAATNNLAPDLRQGDIWKFEMVARCSNGIYKKWQALPKKMMIKFYSLDGGSISLTTPGCVSTKNTRISLTVPTDTGIVDYEENGVLVDLALSTSTGTNSASAWDILQNMGSFRIYLDNTFVANGDTFVYIIDSIKVWIRRKIN